ncbi:MAG TPA: acyltransferase [Caulobacteraceae bacterium]|nr:acyltransferase [Caulobacteraceae bacterium]
MRGISAFVVVLYHLYSARLPLHGYLAVDFFFMLSGFVIAGAHEDRLRAGAGPSWFFAVRMAWLYPMALFGLALGLAYALIAHPGDPLTQVIEFVRSALLVVPHLQGGPEGFAYRLNPVVWSLAVELGVNMLYAWGGWRLGNRALACLMAVAAAAMVPLTEAYGWNNIGGHSTILDLLGAIARVLFAFPFGVLPYRLKRSGWRPRTTFSITTLVALLLLAYAIPTHFVIGVDVLLADLVLPILFVLVLGAPAPQGWSATVFTWMGRVSYAVYAVHYPIVAAVHPSDRHPTLGEASMALALVAAVALFGHLVIEPSGKRLLDRLAPPHRAAHLEG